MDRINKFLAKRPKKNEKVLNFRGTNYVVTKDDLKRVRDYKKGKNIGNVVEPKPFRASEEQIKKLKLNENSYKPSLIKQSVSEDVSRKAFMKKYEESVAKKKIRVRTPEVFDIFPDEGLKELGEHRIEWVYSINTPYTGPVEELKTETAVEVNNFKLIYTKPDPKKSISLSEITQKKSLHYDLQLAKLFDVSIIGNDRNILKEKEKSYYDISCGVKKKLIRDNSILNYSFSSKKIFKDEEMVIKSKKGSIGSLDINKDILAFTTLNSSSFYNIESKELLKSYKFKNENITLIKLISKNSYLKYILGTSHGLQIVENEKAAVYNHLSYVIDFEILNEEHIFAINNLNRLYSIKNEKVTFISLPEIADKVKIYQHEAINLIALRFRNSIGIYQQKTTGGEIMPCNEIKGTYKHLFWGNENPFLYLCGEEKMEMYS